MVRRLFVLALVVVAAVCAGAQAAAQDRKPMTKNKLADRVYDPKLTPAKITKDTMNRGFSDPSELADLRKNTLDKYPEKPIEEFDPNKTGGK